MNFETVIPDLNFQKSIKFFLSNFHRIFIEFTVKLKELIMYTEVTFMGTT